MNMLSIIHSFMWILENYIHVSIDNMFGYEEHYIFCY